MNFYIFNSYMKNDMDNMMDWGQYMWICMVLGGLLFLILLMILLRLLNRNSTRSQVSSIQLNNVSQKSIVGKTEDNKQPMMFSCPNCKEVLSDRTLKYCTNCGIQLN